MPSRETWRYSRCGRKRLRNHRTACARSRPRPIEQSHGMPECASRAACRRKTRHGLLQVGRLLTHVCIEKFGDAKFDHHPRSAHSARFNQHRGRSPSRCAVSQIKRGCDCVIPCTGMFDESGSVIEKRINGLGRCFIEKRNDHSHPWRVIATRIDRLAPAKSSLGHR